MTVQRTRLRGLSLLTLSCVTWLGLSGCSSSSTTTAAVDDGTDTETETATVSGQVAVSAADATSLSLPAKSVYGKSAEPLIIRRPQFSTVADTVLTDATVTVLKINPDGTETTVTTTTTDADGNYTIADLPVASGGTGAATEFFYMIEVTKDDLTVKAPLAPTGDETVNVSPETDLAAKIVENVVEVPDLSSALPIPSPEMIAELRDMTEETVTSLGDGITMPSLLDDSAGVNMASGLTTTGDTAEDMLKVVNFGAERVSLDSESATAADAASFIRRLVQEGCGQPDPQQINPLPVVAAQAMGEALIAGTTYTPTQIIQAFNTVSGEDVVEADTVAAFAVPLTTIDDNFAAAISDVLPFSDTEQVALYAKRDLDGDTFTAATALEADQAIAFLQSIIPPSDNNPCPLATEIDITQVISELTEDSDLGEPQISEVEIYNDSGFGCNAGNGEGHFRARVQLYLPQGAAAVDSIVVTSSDATALDGDGSIELERDGTSSTYLMQDDNVCVTINEEVTYTITATLADATVLDPVEVTRTHPEVPEAQTYYEGVAMSGDENNPTLITEPRPVITWTSPDDSLAELGETAPAGSRIENTYEYSYYQVGGGAPLGGCGSVSSPRYNVDSFIVTQDCDPEACSALLATQGQTVDAATIECRMNIQTYLVDEYDNLLAQAAGEFSFFTLDDDGNGVADSEE